MDRRKLKSAGLGLIGIGVPLSLQISFLIRDHAHQRNDQGAYLLHAQAVYLAFHQQGVLAGFSTLLFDRVWRAILHPYLATPFFFLTGGRAELAAKFCLVAMFFTFLFYVQQLFRRYLPDFQALIATAFLGSCPIFLSPALSFRSEISLLAFAAPFLFYLSKSDLFTSARASALAGAFLGLAICTRPIEALMASTLLGVPVIGIALKRRILRWRDPLALILFWCFGLGILSVEVLKQSNGPANAIYWVALLVPFPALAFKKKWLLSGNFLRFAILSFALPVFWYAPVATQIVGWIYDCTFGQLAHSAGGAGLSQTGFFQSVFSYFGWKLLALLALVAVPNLSFLVKHLKQGSVFVPAIVFPALIGSQTYNQNTRYYLLPALFIYVWFLVLALSGPRAKRLRVAVALGVILIFSTYLWHLELNKPATNRIYRAWIQGPVIYPATGHDPIDEIYASLRPKLANAALAPVDLHVCILQMRQFNDLDWLADPYALTVMSRERGDHFFFDRPSPFVRKSVPEKLEFVKNQCDRILVLPLVYKPAPIEFFMSDVGEAVLQSWKAHELKKDGLEILDHGNFAAKDGNTGEYLLLRPISHEHTSQAL